TKVAGSIASLQGMFGFIDWIDDETRPVARTGKEELSSIDRVYKRFVMHKDLWASSMPTVICEGKTDNIYLRGATRRLAKLHPNLATVGAKGDITFNVR